MRSDMWITGSQTLCCEFLRIYRILRLALFIRFLSFPTLAVHMDSFKILPLWLLETDLDQSYLKATDAAVSFLN